MVRRVVREGRWSRTGLGLAVMRARVDPSGV